MELDDYIKLKGRVESRMKATVITSTGDDNLLSANEKGDLEYRRNQLKKLQNEVVDIEDMDTGVNIMDLGLNEFRLDLLANLKEHPNMDLTPFGMSAVVNASELVEPGVMYVLKNKNNGVNIDRSNLLHPFYMVYLSHTEPLSATICHPKNCLTRCVMPARIRQNRIRHFANSSTRKHVMERICVITVTCCTYHREYYHSERRE